MATSTGTYGATWAADPASAPPADSTGTYSATFAADPAAVASMAATSTGAYSATWAANPISAAAAISTGTYRASFAAEPSSLKPGEILGNVGFSGQVTVTSNSGLEITFPYSDDLQVENLSRRVTLTPTLDTGAHLYDGGYTDTDRDMALTIKSASRTQIDNAKLMMLAGEVKISHWDGFYSGYVFNMSATGGDLELQVYITAKLN